MCIGIPMQLLSVDGLSARASDGAEEHTIDLSLIGAQPSGTWVLIFLGAARNVLSEAEALKIRDAVSALRAIMAGRALVHDAFADLEARGPQLPPHLQAALDAGETTA